MEWGQRELLKTVSCRLAEAKISYMLTGAYSVIYYGRPRASHDIDFVVEINRTDVPKVAQIFREIPGFVVDEFAIEEAVSAKGMFNMVYLPAMIKLDFWLVTDSEFDQQRFKRRRRVRVLGQEIVLSSAEDTILQKLLWDQSAKVEKHLVDAAFVFQLQKQLDKSYLSRWARKLGVVRHLNRLGEIDLEDYY